MTLYDDLPLDTPTKVYETADAEVWATRTINGGLIEERPKPGSSTANRTAIEDRMDQALDAMRAHVTRGTFTAAQRDAALLLVLRVCIGIVRLMRNRLDAAD